MEDTTSQENPRTVSTGDQPIMTEELREQNAKKFAKNLGFEWSVMDSDSKNRCRRIQTSDSSWTPTTNDDSNQFLETSFQRSFEKFCEDNHGSLPPGCQNVEILDERLESLGVFFDAKAVDDYAVLRKQKSGDCCFHASVVFQHYLHCHLNGVADHKMLDICHFLREGLDKEKQRLYIEHGTCGLTSREFFESITGSYYSDVHVHYFHQRTGKKEGKDGIVDHWFNVFVEMFHERYCVNNRLVQPALVTHFHIEPGFFESNVLDGYVPKEKFAAYSRARGKVEWEQCQHSMVLIGCFKDETGKIWFLLQNFHGEGLFKLVSADYMASCVPAVVHALDKCKVTLKEKCQTIDREYSENEDLGLEECAFIWGHEE